MQPVRKEMRWTMPDRNDRVPAGIADMKLSAVQLAELSGLRAEDIHYWARKGYINRSRNGSGSKRPFPMSELEKVRLMGSLTKKYEMDALKASELADELLKMHEREPHAYQAALKLLEAFDKGITTLARVLAEVGFVDAFDKVDKTDKGINPHAKGKRRSLGG